MLRYARAACSSLASRKLLCWSVGLGIGLSSRCLAETGRVHLVVGYSDLQVLVRDGVLWTKVQPGLLIRVIYYTLTILSMGLAYPIAMVLWYRDVFSKPQLCEYVEFTGTASGFLSLFARRYLINLITGGWFSILRADYDLTVEYFKENIRIKPGTPVEVFQ